MSNTKIVNYLNKSIKVVFISKRNKLVDDIWSSDAIISINKAYPIPMKKLLKGEIGMIYGHRIILV